MATETQPVSAAQRAQRLEQIREEWSALCQETTGFCAEDPIDCIAELLRAVDALEAKCALTASASLLVEAQHLEQLAAELRRRVDQAARGEDEPEDEDAELRAKCERLEIHVADQTHIITSQTDHELRLLGANQKLLKVVQGECPVCGQSDLHSAELDGQAAVSCCECDWISTYAALAADGAEALPLNERIDFALKEARRWNATAGKLLCERDRVKAAGPEAL